MKDAAKVINVLVCDDIRREMSGKEILIGAYADVIIVKQIPIKLRSLFVRVLFRISEGTERKFIFKLIDPNKRTIVEGEGSFEVKKTTEPATLPLALGEVEFHAQGIYTIHVSIGGGPTRKVGEFLVRTAEEDRSGSRDAS
jgi:hypothetical protein